MGLEDVVNKRVLDTIWKQTGRPGPNTLKPTDKLADPPLNYVGAQSAGLLLNPIRDAIHAVTRDPATGAITNIDHAAALPTNGMAAQALAVCTTIAQVQTAVFNDVRAGFAQRMELNVSLMAAHSDDAHSALPAMRSLVNRQLHAGKAKKKPNKPGKKPRP